MSRLATRTAPLATTAYWDLGPHYLTVAADLYVDGRRVWISAIRIRTADGGTAWNLRDHGPTGHIPNIADSDLGTYPTRRAALEAGEAAYLRRTGS